MDSSQFFHRRNAAIARGEAGHAHEAETALRSLIHECESQDAEEPRWKAIAESDLAVALAKQGRSKEAEECIRRAHRSARGSHLLVELMVLHNRSVLHDALGNTAESVEWAWQAIEMVRAYEIVLPKLGGKTDFDSMFFELGALELHVVVDYYCYVEPDFAHAEGFLPEAFRWIDRAIEIDSGNRDKIKNLLCAKAGLLGLKGYIKMQLGQKQDARRSFLKASKLYDKAGDREGAANAARLAGVI